MSCAAWRRNDGVCVMPVTELGLRVSALHRENASVDHSRPAFLRRKMVKGQPYWKRRVMVSYSVSGKVFTPACSSRGAVPPGFVITQGQSLRLKIACERFNSSSFWLARWRYTCSFISWYSSTFSFTGLKVSRRRIMWSIASCRFE